MAKELKLNKTQEKELNNYMKKRFLYLEDLRQPFDDKILEEVNLYNDIDKNMQPWDKNKKMGKMWWEEADTVPYEYTIVQTMVARLIQSFFGKQNYLKIYVEDPAYKDIEEDIKLWQQYELDRIKLKPRARDFLEDALIQRTTWLNHLPVMKGGKMVKLDFKVYQWFDVWFDTKAVKTDDSDFFLRELLPLWKLKQNEKMYHNLDMIIKGQPWTEDSATRREVYEAKHSKDGKVSFWDMDSTNPDDEAEVMRYHTWYNVAWKGKTIYKPIIVHWVNRETIIRVEEVELKTEKKFMIFPIRPVKQANSLVGKSPIMVTKDLQYLLNEAMSLTMANFKLLVKLLFKYNKDGDVDLDELWAGGGNSIGWSDNKDDVDIFNIPNMVNVGLMVISWIIQFMQQATGAVDYLMGTSAARGSTETASGIKTITEQAMFKFQMMAENVYNDLQEFINWEMILWLEYNPEHVLKNYPRLAPLTNLTAVDMEDSRILDIGLNDLTLRRDSERAQFINGGNIIAGMLEKVQGNMPAFLKEFMKKLEMDNIPLIMKGAKTPEQIQAAQQQIQELALAAAASVNQKKGGSTKIAPNDSQATPEEVENQTTPNQTTE